MLWLALATALSAAPPKIATTDFTPVGQADKTFVAFVSEHFAQVLAEKSKLQVTTPKAIATVLGLERQKQLLGCSDASTSCIAELAGALGVDFVVSGEVAKLEQSYRLNVRITDAASAQAIFTTSKRAMSQDALVDEATVAAEEAARALVPGAKTQPTPPAPPTQVVVAKPPDAPSPPPQVRRPMPWLVPEIVGGVALATGVTLVLVGALTGFGLSGDPSKEVSATPTPDMIVTRGRTAALLVNVGFIAGGVGLAALVGGIVWGAAASKPKVAIAPSNGGAALVWEGALP